MYLERTLDAQAYFARALKNNEGSLDLKERLNKLNEKYNAKLETEHNVDSIDFKIKEIRERLAYIITELRDRFDNYTVTDFVSKVAELDYLEKQKEKQDKVQKEKDLINEMFGDFKTFHKKKVKKHGVWEIERTSKSSEELINERNERLAVLNRLYNNQEISQEDFVKAVVAVRRRYLSEIKKQVAWEAKKEENQKPSKFRSIVNKVKSAFHLVGGKEQEKMEDNSIGYYSELATSALVKTYELLREEKTETLQNEARNCLSDAVSIHKTSNKVFCSVELEEIVNDMFKKKKEHIEKTTRHTVAGIDNQFIRTREENLDYEINYLADERLNYFSVLGRRQKLKKPEDLKKQAQELENYILKNYKHKYGPSTIREDGAIQLGEIIFENENIQTIYSEMKAMFKQLEGQLKLAQNADKELQQECAKIAQNLQEASI